MDTLQTLQLIENELETVGQMIHEARCCLYTDRRMRQAPHGANDKEWSQIYKLDMRPAIIEPRALSHAEIVYRAQEKVAFAKLKLEMLSRLLNGKDQ